jgi:hypothetical protein
MVGKSKAQRLVKRQQKQQKQQKQQGQQGAPITATPQGHEHHPSPT